MTYFCAAHLARQQEQLGGGSRRDVADPVRQLAEKLALFLSDDEWAAVVPIMDAIKAHRTGTGGQGG